MVRGRSLSNENVINYVNQNFVAIDINCNYGFPANTPALAPFEWFYNQHHTPGQGQGSAKYSRGFTKSLVITADGTSILSATPNASVTDQWRNNPNYNPVGYMEFLQSGDRNYKRFAVQRLSIEDSNSRF